MTPAEARACLGSAPAAVATAVDEALDAVAEAVVIEARRSLGANSPSLPGAAPADPAGRLANAMSTRRGPDGSVAVSVDAPYAADLEYGTRRMAARPFLRPALAATAEATRQRLADALARAVAATFGAGP